MIRLNFASTMVIVACLGLGACSDKVPEIEDGTHAPDSAPAAAAPAASAQSVLGEWTGNIADALQTELCAIDSVNGATAVDGRFEHTANQPVVFEGWASTSDLKRPERITLVLDGVSDYQVGGSTGVAREDVANAYNSTALATAGYRVELASLAVPAGDYGLTLTHEDGGKTVACTSKLTLSVK